mgnify:CR=1 FL=1
MLYPIGIQSFEDIRRGGYVYVDKTALIYKLASTGKYYVLGRPRRFGKSLLISTMEAYFKGRKDLFDGLAIASLEKDWTEYPVLHLDLSGVAYNQEEVIAKVLSNALCKWEKEYGSENNSDIPGIRFGNVIEAACRKTGRQVVILVDEYDKPVIDNLDRPELQDKMRETLRGFYGVMKSKDAFIRFGFLTGVTKIGKMSVFSDLNNPQDISMDKEYPDICGISESDLKVYFTESVKELAEANDLTEEECYRFFDDLCTFSEIQAMTQRLQVAEMLEAGNTFSQISKEIGVSSATITRVNKCLCYGADGYKIVLKRMKEKHAHE